jgi:hypothetical protein
MVFEEWEFASYARSCGELSIWFRFDLERSFAVPGCLSFLYACISRLPDSTIVQNQESYTAFSPVAPVFLYPMHTETMKNTPVRTCHMPHFALPRST